MNDSVDVTGLGKNDAQAICDIYNYYINHSVATFEEREVSVEEMRARVDAVEAQGLPWLVAKKDESILGYAYATQWKSRSAYRFCVEITVYIAQDNCSSGVGSALYKSLFDSLKQTKTRIAIACLSLPNESSVALHEKFGMQKVGHFTEVGFKFDRWVDIGYWQVTL